MFSIKFPTFRRLKTMSQTSNEANLAEVTMGYFNDRDMPVSVPSGSVQQGAIYLEGGSPIVNREGHLTGYQPKLEPLAKDGLLTRITKARPDWKSRWAKWDETSDRRSSSNIRSKAQAPTNHATAPNPREQNIARVSSRDGILSETRQRDLNLPQRPNAGQLPTTEKGIPIFDTSRTIAEQLDEGSKQRSAEAVAAATTPAQQSVPPISLIPEGAIRNDDGTYHYHGQTFASRTAIEGAVRAGAIRVPMPTPAITRADLAEGSDDKDNL
jgi:hypothetical protein